MNSISLGATDPAVEGGGKERNQRSWSAGSMKSPAMARREKSQGPPMSERVLERIEVRMLID